MKNPSYCPDPLPWPFLDMTACRRDPAGYRLLTQWDITGYMVPLAIGVNYKISSMVRNQSEVSWWALTRSY